jgi:hypothetical protein
VVWRAGRRPLPVRCQQSLFEHHSSATIALLAGLEHEPDCAPQLGLTADQQAGGADQHRGMCVMSAGVHPAGVARRKVQPGVLLQRQRIHVRSQQDRPSGQGPAQVGDHRCGALAGADREWQPAQLIQNLRLCERQVEPELGLTVDCAPELHDVVQRFACFP